MAELGVCSGGLRHSDLLRDVALPVSVHGRAGDFVELRYDAVGFARDEGFVDLDAGVVGADGAASCHARGSPRGPGEVEEARCLVV